MEVVSEEEVGSEGKRKRERKEEARAEKGKD